MGNRSLMDRTEASDAFNAGSIPVGCICVTLAYVSSGKICQTFDGCKFTAIVLRMKV